MSTPDPRRTPLDARPRCARGCRRHRRWRLACSLALLAIAACGGSDPEGPPSQQPDPSGDGPLSVYVVNYPLMYFTERIGGDHVAVSFPVPAGIDPAHWQPEAEAIAAFQGADLIVRNGAGYAGWTTMASLPDSKVVDTAQAFSDDVIVEPGALTHSHGPEGEHSHGATAFTTWLDLRQAVLQAQAIAAALTAARPADAADFESNMAALRSDLETLDARLEAATAGRDDVPLFGSHPVYQYLARRYGMNLRSVHFEPDGMPTAQAWAELAGLQGEHPADTMLWESEPMAEIAMRLEQMGITSVVFDPVANRPTEGDFLVVMRSNAEHLEAALAGQPVSQR